MDTQKRCILIVEDNTDDEALLMRQLRKASLDKYVKVIDDGKLALAFLTEHTPSGEELIALFLDLNLPGVSGLEILEKIKSQDRTRNLPVIVMTSSNSPQDLEKCREYGVSCYVQKPVTFANFTKAVADSFHAPATQAGSLPHKSSTAE